jgi:hypothetical protein
MRVANWASDKGATVAHLSPSALYLLSASGVSEEFAERTSSATLGPQFCVSRSRSAHWHGLAILVDRRLSAPHASPERDVRKGWTGVPFFRTVTILNTSGPASKGLVAKRRGNEPHNGRYFWPI